MTEKLAYVEKSKVSAICGSMVDSETQFSLKHFLESIGCKKFLFDGESTQKEIIFDFLDRESYLFNTSIRKIEEADCLLIVGSNPRKEAPVLNSRIRKTWLRSDMKIGLIGEKCDLTYDYEHLGNSMDSLLDSPFFSVFCQSKKPMIFLGESVIYHPEKAGVLGLLGAILRSCPSLVNENWIGFN